MAKQKGPVFFTGCSGGICFYRMDGQYYQRRKSSLSRKRVKRDPAFSRTMHYAGLLGNASRLAADVYRVLPRVQKKHALYRQLTGEAMQLLKKGMEASAVTEQLRQYLASLTVKQALVTKPAGQCRPVKKLRLIARKPAAGRSFGMPEGRLWITGHGALHQLSVHAGDLHHKVLSVRRGRCLVPG